MVVLGEVNRQPNRYNLADDGCTDSFEDWQADR
jgi:hypothetical protein